MKKIYLILTHTGTVLSKIIKTYTKDEFSHSSISLNKELSKMYSFGRIYPSNPFWGGFVQEYIDKGTFKKFSKTVANIYSLEVNDEQYEKLSNIIEEFKCNKKSYKFNILGLFAVGFNKKIRKENGFYCAEFIKYVLEKSEIVSDLPNLIRPEDFKNIDNIKREYKGLLRDYNK